MRRLAPLAIAALTLTAASPATAQRPADYPGVQAVQDLDDAVEHAWMVARDEAPRAAHTVALERLMREMSHLELRRARADAMERFARQYQRARRALFAAGVTPSDATLDAWDDVAAAWAEVRRRVPTGGETSYFELEGRFGAERVHFTGRSLADLHAECMRTLARADMPAPQRITIRGHELFPRGRPYPPAQLCGIAALNAEPVGFVAEPVLTGAIEGVPFVLYAPVERARDALTRFMPDVLAPMTRIDDVRVDDRRYHALASFTAREVIALLERQLPEASVDRLSRR